MVEEVGSVELDQLRALDAVERHGTVSAAAHELVVSQPALSRALSRLERELGHELFDRTPNSLRLNDAGRLAVDFARQTLRSAQRLRDDLDSLASRSRLLRIATVAPAPLWRVAAVVLACAPGAVIAPQMLDEPALERALMNQDVDLAIADSPLTLVGTRSTFLMSERLSVYAPRSHPFAARTSLSLADLDGETFMVLRDIGVWRDVVARAMPRTTLIVQEDQRVYEQVVASSDVLGFVTEQTETLRGGLDRPDRVAVPIDDDATRLDFHLVVPNEPTGPAAPVVRAVAARLT